MTGEMVSLKVDGISGRDCENTIKKAVGALNGVENVDVNLEGKKVVVEFDPERVSVDTIKDIINDLGYQTK
ncbi:MAG: copper ion binding protein [Clostridia bacterium]|nr:copper ion binding protein [Clostridia bacterium]